MSPELIAVLVFGYVFFAIVRGAVRSGKRALDQAGASPSVEGEPSTRDLAEMLARELGITVDTEGGVHVRQVEESRALPAGASDDDAWESFDAEDVRRDDETRLPVPARRPEPPGRLDPSRPPAAHRERRHGYGRRAEDSPLSPERLHDRRSLRRAIILSEVLGKPKSLEE
jgi:hypothetical protein